MDVSTQRATPGQIKEFSDCVFKLYFKHFQLARLIRRKVLIEESALRNCSR